MWSNKCIRPNSVYISNSARTTRITRARLEIALPNFEKPAVVSAKTMLTMCQQYNWARNGVGNLAHGFVLKLRSCAFPTTSYDNLLTDPRFLTGMSIFYKHYCHISDENPQQVEYDKYFFDHLKTFIMNMNTDTLTTANVDTSSEAVVKLATTGYTDNKAKQDAYARMAAHDIIWITLKNHIKSYSQVDKEWVTNFIGKYILQNDRLQFLSYEAYQFFLMNMSQNLFLFRLTFPHVDNVFIRRLFVDGVSCKELCIMSDGEDSDDEDDESGATCPNSMCLEAKRMKLANIKPAATTT